MPNVRQVFERAYGPIPEGATCHVGVTAHGVDNIWPTYYSKAFDRVMSADDGKWVIDHYGTPLKGDIGECDAAAFSPVFQCAAYDAALDALTKEEGEKHDAQDWVDRYSGEWLEDPDPRTVIALADAWMVADDEFTRERDFRKVEAVYEKVGSAKKRFCEASREFWAALSQDGTGESPVLSTHLDVMGVASHQEPDVKHDQPSVSQESSNEA